MILDFSIYEFLKRQLPVHNRQTNRLKLFRWSMLELESLWTSFKAWRKEKYKDVNRYGGRLSLENTLMEKVPGITSVSIKDFDDGGVLMSLREEGTHYISLSLRSEGAPSVPIPLAGEAASSWTEDFRVFANAEADTGKITEVIEKYKLVTKKYLIVQ